MLLGNPYVLIAILVALLASHGGAYYLGGKHMENSIKAEQLEATNKAIEMAGTQATKDNEIIKFVEVEKEVLKNVYIKVRDKVNENIEKNPDYAECALDADGLRLFNNNTSTETEKTTARKPAN